MVTVDPIRNKSDIRKVESILAKQNQRDLLLFTMGINCGLRISDIVKLDVKDVKDKNYIEIIEKKTGKFKKFPLNSKLKPMIYDFTRSRDPKEPLFMTKFSNRLERVASYYIIRRACEQAGIDARIGTHTMRKTFGYHHYKKFNNIAMLQKIFNHSSPQITLRYIGIEQEEIDDSYYKLIL